MTDGLILRRQVSEKNTKLQTFLCKDIRKNLKFQISSRNKDGLPFGNPLFIGVLVCMMSVRGYDA